MTVPRARTLILTRGGAVPYRADLAAFDGTVAGLTLATAPITAHVPVSSIPGATAALAPIHTTLADFDERLTALGV